MGIDEAAKRLRDAAQRERDADADFASAKRELATAQQRYYDAMAARQKAAEDLLNIAAPTEAADA